MIVNLMLPPAVIVHGAADVRAACGAARPVTLLSAPGAASYGGARWWRLVVASAPPGVVAADMLDCADQAGHAVDALREGCRIVILDPASRAFADVAARAAEVGAELRAIAPPALDLGQRGAARRLAAWLDAAKPIG